MSSPRSARLAVNCMMPNVHRNATAELVTRLPNVPSLSLAIRAKWRSLGVKPLPGAFLSLVGTNNLPRKCCDAIGIIELAHCLADRSWGDRLIACIEPVRSPNNLLSTMSCWGSAALGRLSVGSESRSDMTDISPRPSYWLFSRSQIGKKQIASHSRETEFFSSRSSIPGLHRHLNSGPETPLRSNAKNADCEKGNFPRKNEGILNARSGASR